MDRWIVACHCLALAGCEPTSAPGPVSRGGVEPQQPALEPEAPPDDPLERLLHDKAKKYAEGLVRAGPPFKGRLEEGDKRDYLAVLEYGHCYRVVGVGSSGVTDLDLFLHDGSGVQVQQDLGQDPFPVLGLEAELCPFNPDQYRLQVRMARGSGHYAVGVYETPPQ